MIKKAYGRKFVNADFFEPNERLIGLLAQNHCWLNTVERGIEINRSGDKSNKNIIKIVRWRAINDKNDDNKYWRFHRSFNVRSFAEWEQTSNLVESLVISDTYKTNFISVPEEEFDKLNEKSTKLEFEKKKSSAIIQLLKNVNSANELELNLLKKTLALMRSNIKKLQKTLNEFNNLVSNSDTTETQVHDFLVEKDAYWMFGLEYVSFDSNVRLCSGDNSFYFDLMLFRRDGFRDLVELKGPNVNLFDQRTLKRYKPNSSLSEAVGQSFTYLYAIDVNAHEIVKPKAYIVIGKKETDNPSERRVFSSYLSNIDLITYSDLYQRGRQLLKYIKTNIPE